MQKEAVNQIKKAEAEARGIRASAATRVREMTAKAHEDGKARKLAALERAEREGAQAREAEAKYAAKLLEKAEAESETEVKELRAAAAQKTDAAVEQIVWGIIGQWQ